MTLGPLFFAAPLALWALAALPLLWFIIRATPPAPVKAIFPPLRLLLGLSTEDESRKRAPWWLLLLRALAAALMIIGFARPSLNPEVATPLSGAEPILVVIDDGWTSAAAWADMRSSLSAVADQAERARAPVHVLLTAPARTPLDAAEQLTAADARARFARLDPKPWRPDREDALKRLSRAPPAFQRIVWLSDGLEDPGADAFARALAARGRLFVQTPPVTARAVVGVEQTAEGVEATVKRSAEGQGLGALAVETAEGRSLGAATFQFAAGARTTLARVDLPPEIAARAARVRLVNEQSAGAVRLMAQGAGRPLVGLIDPGAQTGQALLSDLYYVDRAIAPFATARRGEAKSLIDQGAQALVLPDASRIAAADREAILKWLERGGLLIRFAGPRLANDQDDLIPVRLRPGARALGGALAWEQPQAFAPFPADSPFATLRPDAEVVVRRQVLADPAAEREARVWARLADGAPIITAAPRGKGLIVLFHVTAGPDWSDLALSGLYVEILRRTLHFAGRAQTGEETPNASAPWRLERMLDGYGAPKPAPADAQPVSPEAMETAKPGPLAPPGLYSRPGGDVRAIDAASAEEAMEPLALPAGATRLARAGPRLTDLAGPLLALAALFIALDLLLSLVLAGRLPRPQMPALPGKARAAALLVAAALLAGLGGAPPALAQGSASEDASLTIRLAYIRTGDTRLDRITEAGLGALSDTLTERTAVEPGPPVGVDPARDDLSAYPILYWAAPDTPTRLADAAIVNLDRYMRLGGLLFLDTRDAGAGRDPQSPGPAAIMLQGFDAPPLEPVGTEHVLTKAFYLLKTFPGRRRGARVFAESESAAAARDGVAALMVGDGDWAGAWAGAAGGFPDRAGELSLRFGVNLVMVALTGNYKADQVHVPALLERLGQEPPRRSQRPQ